MSKKKLTSQEKYTAVIELLEGKSKTVEICNKYGISQTYLYRLRDQAMESFRDRLEKGSGRKSTAEGRLSVELDKAKQLIADQALIISELKKRDY